MRRVTAVLLSVAACLLMSSARGQECSLDRQPLAAPKPWRQILQTLTADESFSALERAVPAYDIPRRFTRELDLDLVLLEIQRRAERPGGDEISRRFHEIVRRRPKEIERLVKLLDRNEAPGINDAESAAAFERLDYHEQTFVLLLTVLRRMQEKPDPVSMQIIGPIGKEQEESDPQAEWTVLEPPDRVRVRFVNRDEEFDSVLMILSTFYSQWRVSGSNRSPDGLQPRFDYMAYSGSFPGYLLELSREKDKDIVDEIRQVDEIHDVELRHFICFESPGTYLLKVQYHPSASLYDRSNREEVEDAVYISSNLIELVLKPAPIEVTAVEVREVVSLFDQIDFTQPIFLIDRWNGEDVGQYIPSDSAVGKIIAREFKSIPGLLNVLERNDLTPESRSWVLGLLYSVVRDIESVPGDHRNGWGERYMAFDGVLHSRYRLTSSIHGATTYKIETSAVDEQKQKQLAEEWIRYLKRNTRIKILEADE